MGELIGRGGMLLTTMGNSPCHHWFLGGKLRDHTSDGQHIARRLRHSPLVWPLPLWKLTCVHNLRICSMWLNSRRHTLIQVSKLDMLGIGLEIKLSLGQILLTGVSSGYAWTFGATSAAAYIAEALRNPLLASALFFLDRLHGSLLRPRR